MSLSGLLRLGLSRLCLSWYRDDTTRCAMTAHPVLLKLLLRQRHWQKHSTFCREFDKAAGSVDPELVGTWPSRAQLHRWCSGELKGLPYPDACRVLEKMFPGWSAEQLFEPCTLEQWETLARHDVELVGADDREPPLVGNGGRSARCLRCRLWASVRTWNARSRSNTWQSTSRVFRRDASRSDTGAP